MMYANPRITSHLDGVFYVIKPKVAVNHNYVRGFRGSIYKIDMRLELMLGLRCG